jgi:hypothetical protein
MVDLKLIIILVVATGAIMVLARAQSRRVPWALTIGALSLFAFVFADDLFLHLSGIPALVTAITVPVISALFCAPRR